MLRTPPILAVIGLLAVIGTLGFNWQVVAPLLARICPAPSRRRVRTAALRNGRRIAGRLRRAHVRRSPERTAAGHRRRRPGVLPDRARNLDLLPARRRADDPRRYRRRRVHRQHQHPPAAAQPTAATSTDHELLRAVDGRLHPGRWLLLGQAVARLGVGSAVWLLCATCVLSVSVVAVIRHLAMAARPTEEPASPIEPLAIAETSIAERRQARRWRDDEPELDAGSGLPTAKGGKLPMPAARIGASVRT